MYCPGFLIEGKVNKEENDLKSKKEIEREGWREEELGSVSLSMSVLSWFSYTPKMPVCRERVVKFITLFILHR